MKNNNYIIDLYKEYPVLKDIDDKNNNIISDNCYFKSINAGEYISSANGICEGVLFLVKGTIKIQRNNHYGEETNLYNIKPGELCHEALRCIINYKSLNIIGKALQDTIACIIPVSIVKNYLLNNINFLEVMYGDLYNKFNIVIETKENKIHETLENRIMKYLTKKKSNIVYITHEELAFDIDSSRVAVSKKLKELENKGLIKLERGKIIILKQ